MDLAAELANRVVVLDGGLATELERRGADLSSSLWSAQLLRDDPGEIVEAHRAFVEAGAEVVTSASYQASFEGLGDEAEQLMRLSVRLARESGPRWVAASVGPYGAVRADGSEYRGDYGLSVTELRLWHRRRLAALADAGADVLAVETLPCLAEVEAVCAELSTLGVPAWVSVTCAGERTRAGEPADEAFALAAECAPVIAVGINCTEPADVPALVAGAAQHGKPVVVYPNSGEAWDARARQWVGPGRFSPDSVLGWADAGARLVGGCCRVRPEDIAAIAGLVRA